MSLLLFIAERTNNQKANGIVLLWVAEYFFGVSTKTTTLSQKYHAVLCGDLFHWMMIFEVFTTSPRFCSIENPI